MTDFYDAIAKYLEAQNIGVFTNSTTRNIFVAKQPSDPDNCITILGLVGTTIGAAREISELQFPRFQLLVRNTDENAASDKFQAVRAALHNKYGVMISLENWRVLRLHVDQEGGPLGPDAQNRFEFSCNFIGEVHYVPSEEP